MADILYQFPINASANQVFEAISSPAGLNSWWAKDSKGKPVTGEIYELGFGPEYAWEAVVSLCIPDKEFEFTLTKADGDWTGSKVGFSLSGNEELTWVEFYHTGWPQRNEHFRISGFCWAMYLRLMKRFLEFGETVVYEERLNV